MYDSPIKIKRLILTLINRTRPKGNTLKEINKCIEKLLSKFDSA